ncbi:branched-chain amino acid ABC transporter permease [Thermus thermophilus]|uniref:Branched-chain amino acid transport system permease protein livH n=2 Tax=Thermus thermophilus TaxID=274 RepID=Q72K20_THET2|nr:branched-chain amino acid ABC transporter permease [Thermus thermophilus]AAS80946.1 branched-chain amino acid transport system permease protein livH [Thermus thermophilus HB27]WMV95985.1 branched-chain amino acid ABC transporter permease [Thermus thermophilus HB27]BBL93491.1 branched-chain amino acid ABC transporter permease [Thermus thermophilus]BCP66105.1 branched-chain amino acid ABC transporter permease [Thermus thermophilus]BCP97881.1 branched-chain amino acid ABC transporter permease 
MDATILGLLLLDGVQNGVIYGLLALAMVLVFAVTRVILVPIGELMMFAPLSFVWLQEGKLPGTLWLALALGVLWALLERGRGRGLPLLGGMGLLLLFLLAQGSPALAYLAALLLVVYLGVATYRVFFQPMREATVLALLIMAVGLHVAYQGLGLVFFGPEQFRPDPLLQGEVVVGLTWQGVLVLAFALLSAAALYLFFRRSLFGKALLAAAENRLGARLCGIRPEEAGMVAFAIAGLMAALSGLLLAPLINAAYFMGFMLGLKAFVAAILGGLVSYPVAFLGAVLVGLFESFTSFYASAYKEALVFLLLVPALFYQSLRAKGVEE